jgi:hypothetical protein
MLTTKDMAYAVKNPGQLSDDEIKTILDNWDVLDWNDMKPEEFKNRFRRSEFHLLTDSTSNLLSIARINFNFKVKIDESEYQIAELVGFVAVEILKGYGKILLDRVSDNLKNRNIEAIGFCKNKNSTFYESCGLKIFYNSVKFLREMKDGKWFTPTQDDDIFSLTLSESTIPLFEKLSHDHPAYLIFE